VIGYLDTSALVPMLISEATSQACREFWNTADAVTSTRLLYVEAVAALARAKRNGRFEDDEHRRAIEVLDRLVVEIEMIEVDQRLIRVAADLAQRFALRGSDAVHCAATALLDVPDLVAASGDRQLLAAWRQLGVASYDPAEPS
jgi:predicted nucleic acid-binding protein